VIRRHGIAQKTYYNWKAKRLVAAAARRAAVEQLLRHAGVSQRRACRVVSQHRSVERYRARCPEPAGLRERLRALAEQRPRFGYRRLHVCCDAKASP